MYKNILQEFCQKQKITLPSYTTVKTPTGFRSSVKIEYNQEIIEKTGDVELSKKEAEKSAAEKTIIYLDRLIQQNKLKYDSFHHIYCMVDMENIYMGNFFVNKVFNNMFKFIGFSTQGHSSLQIKPSEIDPVYTIESSYRDACDVLMIGHICREVDKLEFKELYILTGDHFGEPLVQYLSTLTSKRIIYVKSVEDLEINLNKYLI